MSSNADLEAYARAAARMAGLEIDEEWWPSVLRHLATLVEQASTVAEFVASADGGVPDETAPVFHP